MTATKPKRARITWKRAGFAILTVFTIAMTAGYFDAQSKLAEERAMNRAVIRQHLNRLMIEEGLVDLAATVETDSNEIHWIDGNGVERGSLTFSKPGRKRLVVEWKPIERESE